MFDIGRLRMGQEELVAEKRKGQPTTTRLTLIPVADQLWRVADPSGRVVGHLATRWSESGRRYVARRYHADSRAFRSIGEFWSAQEALDCLRLSR